MNRSTLMTEYQDISQRLEYLVAHSSQMVFVTGEDMAIQKGFVEAFLGQQSQHANVAFLAAKKGKKKDYYRQQLAEQLYLESFNQRQTLVQSFASRNDKDTPVLIAVTNAEYMAKDMLRELWDLVLQNRFARTDEQVNILVFGEQKWAEEVKAWLPTNNNDKPVLLTTQTLEYEEEHEIEGDLDEMINNRRKLFQERMKARSLTFEGHTPVLKAWWFRLVTACFFVVSFSAILIWQYFDVTSTAAREFANFLFQSEITETVNQEGSEATSANQVEFTEESQSSNANERIPVEQHSAKNNRPRISAAIKTEMPTSQNLANDNARASDSFAAALSSLDGPRPPVSEQQAQQNDIVTRSRPSPDQAKQEFVADISTEQLKALRARTEQQVPQSEDDLTLATPQESFQELSQSLLQEASAMQGEQQQLSSTAANSVGRQDTSSTDPALDAAINAALKVMSQFQNNEVLDSGQQSLPDNDNQAIADVLVDALAPDSAPVELSQAQSQNETGGLSEEAIINGGEVEDYPVEDIVSEAQVLAQNNSTQPASGDSTYVTPVSEVEDLSESVNSLAVTAPEVTSTGLSTPETDAASLPTTDIPIVTQAEASTAAAPEVTNAANSFAYNEDILLDQSSDNYVLQISGLSSADLLIDYLTDNNLAQRVWVYHTQRYGGDWFVVLYNQSYATLDEARRSVAQVTSLLPNAQPFVKSMAQVQQEIEVLSQ
ncbi:MAG: SPOR domain-containing protein [Aestuariibacter sp.]